MHAVLVLVVAILLTDGFAVAQATEITGRPTRIADGDTFDLPAGGSVARIRLFGIDAPERKQRCAQAGACSACGREAAAHLRGLIGEDRVRCRLTGEVSYGRSIATCYVGNNDKSLNLQMAEAGWAVAYRYYSSRYVKAEKRARDGNLGVWSGRFVVPQRWREGERLHGCE